MRHLDNPKKRPTDNPKKRPAAMVVPLLVLLLVLAACGSSPPAGGGPLGVTLNASPTQGTAPLTVAFTATATAPSGPLTHAWEFGDGNTAPEGRNQEHTYTSAGTFTARVTVSDGRSEATDEVVITVSAPDPAAVPYYGEWRWSLVYDGAFQPFEGKLSIGQIAPGADEFHDGGMGTWAWCPSECGAPEGTGIMQAFDEAGERLLRVEFIEEDEGGSATRMVAFGDDPEPGTDDQGRATFLVRGTWFFEDGSEQAVTLTMYKIGDTPETE